MSSHPDNGHADNVLSEVEFTASQSRQPHKCCSPSFDRNAPSSRAARPLAFAAETHLADRASEHIELASSTARNPLSSHDRLRGDPISLAIQVLLIKALRTSVERERHRRRHSNSVDAATSLDVRSWEFHRHNRQQVPRANNLTISRSRVVTFPHVSHLDVRQRDASIRLACEPLAPTFSEIGRARTAARTPTRDSKCQFQR